EGTVRNEFADAAHPTAPTDTVPLLGDLSWYQDTAGRITRQAATLARLSPRAVRHPIDALRSTVSLRGSTAKFARPIATTLSPVMTERSTRRRCATVDLPVADLGRAASAAGGSINDGFLASILLGMAQYHRAH